MVILENVSRHFDHNDTARHDVSVKNGTAQGFASCLHQQFKVQPLGESSNHLSSLRLGYSRASQVAVTCKAIDSILRCSDDVLKQYGERFIKQHLFPCLPRVVKILAHWKGDSTLRLVTLSSAIRIMRRILPVSDQSPTRFVQIMCILLQDSLPSDIRIDAARAIAEFIDGETTTESEPRLLGRDTWSRLVAILCTSASASDRDSGQSSMQAIARLVKYKPFLSKLAKQGTCTRLVLENLRDENFEHREYAIHIAVAILSRSDKGSTPESTKFQSNTNVLAEGVIQAAVKETNPALLACLLDALKSLTDNDDTFSYHLPSILKVIFVIAVSEDKYEDDLSNCAADYYLDASSHAMDSLEVLSNVADFTTYANAQVRQKALGIIQEVTFWKPEKGTMLLTDTAFLENMSLILAHTSDQDCHSALRILKQLLFDSANRSRILQHTALMSALVALVTTEPVKNQRLYRVGVDLVLDILVDPKALAAHPELLPWMVTLANRTCCEELKARLIPAIVEFSAVILQE